MWGKILTNDNLRKRGVILVGWCSLCRCSGETIDHLLINCDCVCVWSYVEFSSFVSDGNFVEGAKLPYF